MALKFLAVLVLPLHLTLYVEYFPTLLHANILQNEIVLSDSKREQSFLHSALFALPCLKRNHFLLLYSSFLWYVSPYLFIFLKRFIYFERGSTSVQAGEAQSKRENEHPKQGPCCRQSHRRGLDLTNDEILSWAEIESGLTLQATQAPCLSPYLKLILYLPGRGDTMILKVVFSGRGLPVALQMCWPLQFPAQSVAAGRWFPLSPIFSSLRPDLTSSGLHTCSLCVLPPGLVARQPPCVGRFSQEDFTKWWERVILRSSVWVLKQLEFLFAWLVSWRRP